MIPRSRSCVAALPVVWTLGLSLLAAGCSDAFNSGPLQYAESKKLTAELGDKPELRAAVRTALVDLFGPEPRTIKVPEGSGLPGGGIYLASHRRTADGGTQRIQSERVVEGEKVLIDQKGGYGLYRQHCLHCHGVSGAGDGPTSTFLFPRPRDYRRGVFKFTSTPTGIKPTRADLRRTLVHGLDGTSMPAFEALMTEAEIEQVIDYMTFLSMRGETELALIDEASAAGELPAEVVTELSGSVLNKWKSAEEQAVNPPSAKAPSTRASVLRGRDVFLGRNATGNKAACADCHGRLGKGDGASFVALDVFNDVVFGGDPSTMPDRVAAYDEKTRGLWKNSLDDWGDPLRPANLARGVYKGGRRPIDLYWRLAHGINGAKMPAHVPSLETGRIWDLVDFVLALPDDPGLLEGLAPPEPGPPTPAVARR